MKEKIKNITRPRAIHKEKSKIIIEKVYIKKKQK